MAWREREGSSRVTGSIFGLAAVLVPEAAVMALPLLWGLS